MMTNSAKQVARRYIEKVVGNGDLSQLSELIDPNCVWNIAPHETPIRGLDQHRQFVAGYVGLWGDIDLAVEDTVAEGDRVAVRWVARTQNQDDSVMGMSFFRFDGDRIAEVWTTWDTLAVAQASSEADVLQELSISL